MSKIRNLSAQTSYLAKEIAKAEEEIRIRELSMNAWKKRLESQRRSLETLEILAQLEELAVV